MGNWVSIRGQMLLPLACRPEAERLVKEFYSVFEHLDVDFQNQPDSFQLRLEAYGVVNGAGSIEAALCGLGKEAKTLAQFRIITADRNDYIFLGNARQVNITEQLAYKLDAVADRLHNLSPQEQRVLSSCLDDLLFMSSRTGTDGN